MSKRFFEFGANGENIAVGSPADIRKACRWLEQTGFCNLYCSRPIMREGRLYAVSWPLDPSTSSTGHTYTVGRWDKVKTERN